MTIKAKMANPIQISEELKQLIKQTQPKVDRAISQTPTGEVREALTDTNIILMILIEKLK